MTKDRDRAAAPLGVRSPGSGSDVDGTGPYVVTVWRPCPEGHTEPLMQGDGGGSDGSNYHTPPCPVCDDRCEILTRRRAWATWEEARWSAVGRIAKSAFDAGTTDGYQPFEDAAKALPPSGGTVGPLPDGTVIEVEPVGAIDLFNRAGLPKGPPYKPVAEVIAAFNAMDQSARHPRPPRERLSAQRHNPPKTSDVPDSPRDVAAHEGANRT